MKYLSRRDFLRRTAITGLGLSTAGTLSSFYTAGPKMRFGLVTYQWGRDWDLPTLIANCEKTGLWGIELRTEHAHKVEINLSATR
ncbi:MAG TPA: twin-arginine translocation signal domain-containing protein, partial [Agriterribacter sp.]|nr:twin-arginine translocation signal domain-containing protein [Agriterribacter sp.]